MPLARIISPAAGDFHVLAKQLRSRGFAVETMSLDATPNAPADLEIRLEDYAFHEALKVANKTPDGTDLCVFIAPSAITELARLVRVTRLTAEAAEAVRREEPGPTEDHSQETAPAQVELVPEGETLKQGTQEVFTEAVPSGLEPGTEQLGEAVQMAEPVASSSVQPVAQTDVDENSFPFEERAVAVGEGEAALVSAKATIPAGQEEAAISSEETVGGEWLPEPVSSSSGEPAQSVAQETTAATQSECEAFAAGVLDPNIHEAQVRIPAGAEEGVLRSSEVLPSPGSSQELAPIAVSRDTGAQPESESPGRGTSASTPGGGLLRRLRHSVVRRGAGLGADGLFWKTAAGLAAAALLVLTLGATVLRFAPLPGGLLQSSTSAEQQVPFAPAIIATNSAAPRVAAAGSVSPKMQAKPAPRRRRSKPVVLPTKFNPTAGRPARRRPTSAEAGIVARDTVIHYGRRPAPPLVKAQKKPGIKRYSDLD